MTALDVTILMPEIILAVFGFVLLIFGASCGDRVSRGVDGLAILAFVLAGASFFYPERAAHLLGDGLPTFAFGTMFVDNAFTTFVKLILVASAALSVLLAMRFNRDNKTDRFEYSVLVVFATIGMMMMVSASDFLALYVGLELQSLALYVLAAFNRDNARSSEAGLKYFVLGALASGILLYGISLIYGYVGSTEFINVAVSLKNAPAHSYGIMVGVVFVCAALAFKVSAVPFHMWTPDVYEGAPTPVAAFFSAAPKVAALALFIRVLYIPLGAQHHDWGQMIVVLAVASMMLGSFAGVVQSNVKRLMAYSSIANVGFALAAMATVTQAGVQAVLIYLAIYFLNTLGAFGIILCLRRDEKPVEQLSDFSGLSKTHPLLALSMVIFMFSMAGVPPMAGFFGKYFVFLSVMNAHMLPLAVIGVLTSVVSAFYYLRIVKIMYFDDVKEPISPLAGAGVPAVVLVSALFMLAFTLWPSPIIERANTAAQSVISVAKPPALHGAG